MAWLSGNLMKAFLTMWDLEISDMTISRAAVQTTTEATDDFLFQGT